MTDTDLIEKLSKLDGPCRECDADINDALYYTHLWNSERYSLPEYTASIDAALTLVPEGLYVDQMGVWPSDISRKHGKHYCILGPSPDRLKPNPYRCQHHDNWATAICIASLRAIEAMEGE